MRVLAWSTVLLILFPVAAGAVASLARGWPANWRSADWSSTGTLADPANDHDAMIGIYAARSGRWKGIFADHHWIVTKPAGAASYSRYEVVGWGNPVRHNARAADGRWYGNDPIAVHMVRGRAAERLIPRIEEAIASYPWSKAGTYRAWPGPNSNSFVAYVLRKVPELGGEMRPTGVGKDYLGPGLQFAVTPSGTGFQVSAWGVAGASLSWREGLELHVLGATIGIDPEELAISLPALGKFALRPRS